MGATSPTRTYHLMGSCFRHTQAPYLLVDFRAVARHHPEGLGHCVAEVAVDLFSLTPKMAANK